MVSEQARGGPGAARPWETPRVVERFLVSAERSAPGDVEPPDQLLARRALLPAALVERLEAVGLAAGASSVEERGP